MVIIIAEGMLCTVRACVLSNAYRIILLLPALGTLLPILYMGPACFTAWIDYSLILSNRSQFSLKKTRFTMCVCVRVCVRACVRAFVRACVRACVRRQPM